MTKVELKSAWDGGSRSEYAIVKVDTLERKALPTSTHPYFDVSGRGISPGDNGAVAVDAQGSITLKFLPPDFVLVEAGTFMGKPATAHIYVSVATQLALPASI